MWLLLHSLLAGQCLQYVGKAKCHELIPRVPSLTAAQRHNPLLG
jgi:hypothetical protein